MPAVYKYQESIADSRTGRPVQNAQVQVFQSASGDPAILYSASGAVSTAPILTDQDGYFCFWAAAGRYDIRCTFGSATKNFTDITIGLSTAILEDVELLAVQDLALSEGPWVDPRHPIFEGSLAAADTAAVAEGKLMVISDRWDVVPSTLNSKIKILPGGQLNDNGTVTINGNFEGAKDAFGPNQSVVFGAGVLSNRLSGRNSRITDYKFLSGVVRNNSGTWSFIDDAGHSPTNLASISEIDVYTIRINYGETYDKVSTFMLNPDDALAPYGVTLGSDVGTSYANITFAAPFSCAFNGAGDFTKIAPIWQDYVTLTPNGRGFTVTHPQTAAKLSYGTIGEDGAVVSIEAASDGSASVPMGLVVSEITRTSFNVHAVEDLNGFIAYGGSSWAQTLSTNLDAPVLSWTAGNVLRVAHDDVVKNILPELTGFGGTYLVQVMDVGPAYFEVAFFDYAGTKITTPNTNMKFGYRRPGPVASAIPAGLIINCRRGYMQVPPEGLKNVDGNNFWLFAVMEK